MTRDTCKYLGCARKPGSETTTSTYNERKFCSARCEVKYDHIKADAQDATREEPARSEPADFGGGESTGVQDL